MLINDLGIIIKELWITHPTDRYSTFLAKFISKYKFKNVLEIGTGTGIVSICLAKNGSKVTATDIDKKIIDLAQENAKLNNVKIKLIVSDLYENVKGRYDCIVFSIPYILSKKRYNYINFLYDKFMPEVIESRLTYMIDNSIIGRLISRDRWNKLKYLLKSSKDYLNKNRFIYLVVFKSDIKIIKRFDNIAYSIIEFPFVTSQCIVKISYKN
ncbi:methyltransferase [Candidatus Woesearchaeota archaeon]|nr:methyltransferase [Candidatus Woesearchaeota archaeon]